MFSSAIRRGAGLFALLALTGTARAADLDIAAADAYLSAWSVCGFAGSVRVETGGTVRLDKGYGTLRGVASEAGTRYWLASVSKQFAGAAVLKLVETGKLRLDEPLGEIFRNVPADKAGITVRQLLDHKSGLPKAAYAADGLADRDKAVAAILALKLSRPPGTSFAYSNDNYALAVAIVEAVSGTRYEDFLRLNFFAPTGMTATGFWGGEGSDKAAPVLHPDAELFTQPAYRHRNWGMLGSDGLNSTTADLSAWLAALNADRVLTAGNVALLTGAAGQDGFGWFRSEGPHGVRLWARGTEDFGARALMEVYADRDVRVILLSHAGDSPAGRPYNQVLQEGLEAALFGDPMPDIAAPTCRP